MEGIEMTATDEVAQPEGPPKEKTPQEWAQFWQKEFKAAQKRLRVFKKQGDGVVNRYLGEQVHGDTARGWGPNPNVSRLNLFHTNITTVCSMMYGSVPQVDVSREHLDPDDDVARVAALLYQRILQADVQPSGSDFPTHLKSALLDRLLPGLGVCRVRYEVQTEEMPALDPQTMQITMQEQMVSEDAPVDYVHWQDFLWSWARTWGEVWWLGFRSFLTKKEVEKRFGPQAAKDVEYKKQKPTGDDDTDLAYNKDQESVEQKAEIWEFWCKKTKRVYWWSEGAGAILDAKDDPLKLDGFWPVPKPLVANVTTTLYTPRADFIFAQDLYNEIDELQTRISLITRAIKVVGVYDKSAGDSVGRMLKEGVENDLIPVDNWAMFAEKGALKGLIDWFPVETVVATLQTLVSLRDQAIENLYQVTGMSDIMRGANTDQYTSDGTQQLKAKFGSVRIQALQDQFAQFASDLEALKAEVISKHFSPETIAKQAVAQYLPQGDQQLIQPAIQLMQSPDVKWRIEIRPESIAMIDYAQLKSERTEFLGAMSNYIQSAQAMAKAVPGSLPIMMEMMKWGMSGFKGSNYLEGIMDRAIEGAIKAEQQAQQQGPQPDPQQQAEQAKAQAQMQLEQMKGQNDMQKIQAKAQADLQTTQAKIQGEIAKINADAQRDMALEDRQSQYALLEIAREMEAQIAELQAQLDSSLTIESHQALEDMRVNEQEHAHKLAEIRAAGVGRRE